VFDLAADIECYPQYLTGYISARIQRRDSNLCYVEQVVGFGPIRLQFASIAALHRPERIDVAASGGYYVAAYADDVRTGLQRLIDLGLLQLPNPEAPRAVSASRVPLDPDAALAACALFTVTTPLTRVLRT
jgi:hypothetical protein